MTDKQKLIATCRERMQRLLELKAPDVIIANEAEIFLTRYHGGRWKALSAWATKLLRDEASNQWFDLRVMYYRVFHNLTEDEAIDVIIGPVESELDALEKELDLP